MESIDLRRIHVRDPNLADYFMRTYASHSTHSTHSSALITIPSLGTWWWGSREQVVFLQVLSALLRRRLDMDMDKDKDKDNNPAAAIDLQPALMYCPGPWDQKSLDLISSQHDDLSLVAACVIVGARWCLKNQTRISDFSERVHACMAGRLWGDAAYSSDDRPFGMFEKHSLNTRPSHKKYRKSHSTLLIIIIGFKHLPR